MSTTVAVIGANFGDEGKGLITDFETRRLGAKYVSRMNGGAQAGHTVVTENGERHVFGHIAAGAFAGADTILPSKFIVNPLVFEKEYAALGSRARNVYVHQDAQVSTIWDMALNSIAEILRTNRGGRHGSCGLGINETVQRGLAGYRLPFSDLKHKSMEELCEFLSKVHSDYVMPRLIKQDFNNLSSAAEQHLHSLINVCVFPKFETLAERLVLGASNMICGIPDFDGHLVIEGAQGLALDQDLGVFPHVTHSITGLESAVAVAVELGRSSIEPVYVTRAYLTRHGAGPLQYENEPFTNVPVSDQTNIENQWQGKLRYAPLNLPQLAEFIKRDYSRATSSAQLQISEPTLAITCLDQVGNKVKVVALDDTIIEIDTENLLGYVALALNIRVSHSSRGPMASNVIRR